MNTPKSLLALAESPEGQEQVRIIAGEIDGWTQIAFRKHPESNKICNDEPDELWFGINPEKTGVRKLAEYTTSLDAIFAAEKRLGLHDFNNYDMRVFWYHQADHLSQLQTGIQLESHDMAFVSILDRCICFILTAQHYRDNHEQ